MENNKNLKVAPNCFRWSSSAEDENYVQDLKSGISTYGLEIKLSSIPGAGLGVFAKKRFKPSEIIERCHLIRIPTRIQQIQPYSVRREIAKYSFGFTCDCEACKIDGLFPSIALGFGSMYNTALSSEEANCHFYVNIHTPVVIFYATKLILPNEEIFIYYGSNNVNSFVRRQEG